VAHELWDFWLKNSGICATAHTQTWLKNYGILQRTVKTLKERELEALFNGMAAQGYRYRDMTPVSAPGGWSAGTLAGVTTDFVVVFERPVPTRADDAAHTVR